MSNSNKKRAEQLGMPYGTAANKLKKMLLFKFAQELGYDQCFVCKKPIEVVDDLSIEHKDPWFNRPGGTEKFWDLSNIAFSHLSCNRPHRTNSEVMRKVGPTGTRWCYKCKEYLPLDSFQSNKSHWSGKNNLCKEHQAEQDYERRVSEERKEAERQKSLRYDREILRMTQEGLSTRQIGAKLGISNVAVWRRQKLMV